MNSRNILSTQFAQTLAMSTQLQQVVHYLVQNRRFVIDEHTLKSILNVRTILPNNIDKLFEQCVNTGYINEFASLLPITIRGDTSSHVPDLLTMRSMVIDLKDNPIAHPLEAFPELYNKIILNLSELVKIDPVSGSARISDINELHSMYVRGMLVRSYSQANEWLPPNLAAYVIQVYAMAISSVIARAENLVLKDQLIVAAIFAMYMAQHIGRRDEHNLSRPALYFRCTFLGTMRDLDDLAEKMSHLSKDGLTIASACELVATLGPSRLQKFNPGIFYRACGTLGPSIDIFSSRLALEYPPYFAMMILRALDGLKMGSLMSYMKQHNLINTGKAFSHSLMTSRTVFENR